MSDRDVGHEFDASCNADVVNACIHQSKTSGDGLVGRNAGHGDRMCGNPIGESGAQHGFSGDVGGFDLLDDRAATYIVHEIAVQAETVDQAEQGISDKGKLGII